MSIWFLPGRHGTPTGFRARWFSEKIGARPLFLDPEKPFDWLADDLKRRISEQGSPECLIGVSSGAALVWKLLHDGAWEGPVLLLSPAIKLYQQPLSAPSNGHGVIFHGERDSVVSIEDSISAVADSNGRFSLIRCHDQEHALRDLFNEPRLEEAMVSLGLKLLS